MTSYQLQGVQLATAGPFLGMTSAALQAMRITQLVPLVALISSCGDRLHAIGITVNPLSTVQSLVTRPTVSDLQTVSAQNQTNAVNTNGVSSTGNWTFPNTASAVSSGDISLLIPARSFVSAESYAKYEFTLTETVTGSFVGNSSTEALYYCRHFFSNRLMSTHMRRSDAASDMQANLVSGRLRGDPRPCRDLFPALPSFTLPFANPYIPWPPYFDYLSHFASSTLASHVKLLAQSFRKAEKNGQGSDYKLSAHDVMESRRRHWVTDC